MRGHGIVRANRAAKARGQAATVVYAHVKPKRGGKQIVVDLLLLRR